MWLAGRLALRDLRGGRASLRIVLACLALGVAAIATVGGLRDAISGGLAAHGRQILGGDLEISTGNEVAPAALRRFLADRHARVSEVWQLRSMLVAGNGERQLVELKAVDTAWPLLGTMRTQPAQPGPVHGLLAERLILSRLGIGVGDTVRLGDAHPAIEAVLTEEPDHAATPSLLGPRVLIPLSMLPQTGLVQPGSMVTHMLRVVWPAGSDARLAQAAVQAAFADRGWHLRDAGDAVPGASRFIEQLALFMSLVGMTSLLVGGIGVATGVRAWLEGRARMIAVLRCLGASGRMVFAVVFAQVALLAAGGIALGLAAGAALPVAALWLFRSALPVPPVLGVYPGPLGAAAAMGVLVALVFALPPLARATRIPGAALFRAGLQPSVGPRWDWRLWLATGVPGVLLVALAVASSPDRRLAIGFCVAAALVLGLFRFGAWGIVTAARRMHPSAAALRLGLGNLHRPGNATALMLTAMGLGLSTLAAVALIEGNMRAQIEGQMPKRAPSFFFIDIQPDQHDAFAAAVRAVPGSTDVQTVPSLVARVVAVNGVAVEKLHPTPQTAWAMRGDRGLTYAATPPAGTRLVEGRWWAADYAGAPLLSFDADLAKGWGVKIGDTVTVTVLGRPVTLTIANLRHIDWRSMSMNFAMVASPGLLSAAPHTELATVRVPAAQEGALLRTVTDRLPNVTGIRVADVLASVGRLLGQIGAALAATGSLTLASGALVLAGTIASGQRRRRAEAVVLKSLGATRRQLRTAWLAEFGMLGLAAGLLAAAVGAASSFAMMHWVLHAGWSLLPWRLAGTVLGCVALMLALGYAGTASALRARPAPLLRNE